MLEIVLLLRYYYPNTTAVREYELELLVGVLKHCPWLLSSDAIKEDYKYVDGVWC